ncbi:MULTISPECIES: YppE family protein [Sutcliffiella]|uniref:DUF1798 family protein n=1 Tax=Sutcliffiella cohnii TaxID=33932 RepID=A0A223KQH2_9BACI|nr:MULTISPECIES: YppE family protein [Sutcliffiella]AST91604.1 hypothetical protein BC6307_10075 [Sutcliffiella cohnii]MED4014817.1 YppE family protein [Sutcliffiella cohnii]WBL17434.1 YppE family protein [Sutcliffiella sp. NC1]
MPELVNAKALSQQLLKDVDGMQQQFWKTREREEEYDFFTTVKPEADRIHSCTEEWVRETKKWIIENGPKYIHANQIDATAENINLIAVQCFFKNTSKKRFFDMCQSITYILEDIIKKWEETK